MMFHNRTDAGRRLAERLALLAEDHPIVLALAGGGVPVAVEVARALQAPLDVIVARKVRAPHHPELAIGAVSEGGVTFVDEELCRTLRVPAILVARLAGHERGALEEAVLRLRGGRPLPDLVDRSVILVDDALHTGATARAAVRALGLLRPRFVTLAVPVAAAHTAERLRHEVDAVVSVIQPSVLGGFRRWYDDFAPVSDDEVAALLGAPPQILQPESSPPKSARVPSLAPGE